MGTTPDELRYELEQQRESLSRDLVAIGDRVSPGRMVERRKMAVRDSFGRARDAVMGARDTAAGTTQQGWRHADRSAPRRRPPSRASARWHPPWATP